jgi:hypothetical protein
MPMTWEPTLFPHSDPTSTEEDMNVWNRAIQDGELMAHRLDREQERKKIRQRLGFRHPLTIANSCSEEENADKSSSRKPPPPGGAASAPIISHPFQGQTYYFTSPKQKPKPQQQKVFCKYCGRNSKQHPQQPCFHLQEKYCSLCGQKGTHKWQRCQQREKIMQAATKNMSSFAYGQKITFPTPDLHIAKWFEDKQLMKLYDAALEKDPKYGQYYHHQPDGVIINNGFMYVNFGARGIDNEGPWRLIVPGLLKDTSGKLLTHTLLEQAHQETGHGLQKIMYNNLTDKFYWKGIYADVNTFCKGCLACQQATSPTQHPYGLLHSIEVPKRPLQLVTIDFIDIKDTYVPLSVLYPHLLKVPGMSTKVLCFKKACLIVDVLTSYTWIIPVHKEFQLNILLRSGILSYFLLLDTLIRLFLIEIPC